MRNIQSVINVYNKKNKNSQLVTQLLYGESFKIIKKNNKWIKISNDYDHYKGFIKNRDFPTNQKNTHKVCNLRANLYIKPNLKNKLKKELSFGSKIKILKKKK